ncbi:MAG: hypothetical protein IKJ09_00660 [Bacteroidaceae bacterium]|nr:hypothetical protein [Bacteroidaceae bacterium]
MRYSTDDILREVRIAIDENGSSDQLSTLDDITTLAIDEIIMTKIADAARIVESNAPIHLLGRGESFSTSISWETRVGNGSGSTQLPDDFMRLISFQMSDWRRAVSIAISEDDDLYQLQSSRYPGIRGCPQNPVVAIVRQPIGLVLEFYSCTSGDRCYVKRARYLPIPRIENGYIDLCEKLRPAIIYYTAYLTCATLGRNEVASHMLNISKSLMV